MMMMMMIIIIITIIVVVVVVSDVVAAIIINIINIIWHFMFITDYNYQQIPRVMIREISNRKKGENRGKNKGDTESTQEGMEIKTKDTT